MSAACPTAALNMEWVRAVTIEGLNVNSQVLKNYQHEAKHDIMTLINLLVKLQ